MFVYWLMFLVPAYASIAQPRPQMVLSRKIGMNWSLTWLLLTLLIGYRFEVGGDWFLYMDEFDRASDLSFTEYMEFALSKDALYLLLNWISSEIGWGIYGVNLICGALFSLCLVTFCRQQPRPWLALLVAIPYLVIVVAMGYSRQGVAIGLIMLGLVALSKKNNLRFVLWVTLAALFHKSAVILIPLTILVATRRRWWTVLWVGVSAVLLFGAVLQEHLYTLDIGYLASHMSSEGGAVRVAMNAIAALIFMVFRRRFILEKQDRRLWTWMSLIALLFVALLIVSPSSTAVDRVALYMIPLQLFVFSRLPDIWGGRQAVFGTVLAVVMYYAIVQFVWLNFAIHAFSWLPYRFYPMELLLNYID